MAEAGPFIVAMFFGGLIGAAIGNGRNIGVGGGFMVGVLLGPIGWLIAAASPRPAPPTTLERIERRPDVAGWHPDPLGRFDSRWFDGTAWTQHVGRQNADGTRGQFEDPL